MQPRKPRPHFFAEWVRDIGLGIGLAALIAATLVAAVVAWGVFGR